MTAQKQPLLPQRAAFQQSHNGKPVDLFFLQSQHIQVAITNYGARIVSLLVKDQHQQWTDVIVGFDSLKGYLEATEYYHGAIIGRYANRIAKGSFSLNNRVYQLAINNDPNHLHGGPKGFHDVVWQAIQEDEKRLQLIYTSADGEEGYPGMLTIKVTYRLEAEALHIDFEAATDKDTVLNVTNHAYFNLNGQGSGPIDKHLLQLAAPFYTPVDEALIPTGEIAPVKDTPFDFMTIKEIGLHINDSHPQIQHGLGYDHNFVLAKKAGMLAMAAQAVGDKTGIVLEVHTTEPGLQFYSGNFMKGEHIIKGGLKDAHRTAFCLETQHFPDAPNQPAFPSTVLRPGTIFSSKTVFRFSVVAQ